MRNVVYTGPSTYRVLDEDDFHALGVDHKLVEFKHGESVEVSNALADALLSSPLVASTFAEAPAKDEEVVEDEPLIQFDSTGKRINAPEEEEVSTPTAGANGEEISPGEGEPRISENVIDDRPIESTPSPDEPQDEAASTGKPTAKSKSSSKSP